MNELTQELRESLKKEAPCSRITMNVKKISAFIKQFKDLLVKDVKWQQAENPSEKSIQILIPDPIPEQLSRFIAENQCEVKASLQVLTYNNLTYTEALERLIPVAVPKGFEMIGKIAHFNLCPEQRPYMKIIGQVLLDKNKQLVTVCNKTEKLHNVYRTPTLELMAGRHDYNAVVPEGNVKFHLNFEEVYWCTRLYSERERIIKLIQGISPNPRVLDLFCGIGPLSIRIAKQLKARCYANDLNPHCFKYLKQNIQINGVEELVTPDNRDAKDIILDIYSKKINFEFDHVYMNLPVLAIDFLGLFKGFCKKTGKLELPYIHVYGFVKGSTDEELINGVTARIRGQLPGFEKDQIIKFHVVKNVTKLKKMTCTTFRLDANSANMDFDFRGVNLDDLSEEEPDQFEEEEHVAENLQQQKPQADEEEIPGEKARKQVKHE